MHGGGLGRGRGEIISVANHPYCTEEENDSRKNEAFRARSASLPLTNGHAKAAAQKDQDDHVDRPARKLEFAHPDMREPVKKELQVPKQAREKGQGIISR